MNPKTLERELHGLLPLYPPCNWRILRCDTELSVSVSLNELTRNHFGGQHAAVTFTAAESLGALLFMQVAGSFEHWHGVVRECTIKYLKPANSDIRAVAHLPSDLVQDYQNALRKMGRLDMSLDAQVFDASGETVATSQAVYSVRPHK